MKISTLIRRSFVIGFLVTLLFMMMEVVNRWHQSYDFPVVLFAGLWLLASVFLGTLFIIFHDVKSKRYPKGIWKLVISAFLMVSSLTLWLFIVNDQMPCFLGVLNCD